MLIHSTGQGPCAMEHIGTVEDIIAAQPSKKVTAQRIRASDFSMGFELASPKGISSLGETVVVNGFCYTTSADQESPDYSKTISGKFFTPGGLFLIPKETWPSHHVQVTDKMSILDFYNTLYKKIERPLAFAGIFHFTSFRGTAIGKAPINGRNIFTYQREYYPNPIIREKNIYAFVIGALTNFRGYSKINRELKTVLYKNPMDVSAPLINHAHCLLLKKNVESFTQIVPSVVDQTLHLFAEGTQIRSANVEIFTVGSVRKARERAKDSI